MVESTELDSVDMEIIMMGEFDKIALSKSDLYAVFLNFQKTPQQFIKQRPGRGGKPVDYVEGWYIKQVLNLATKFKWSSYIDGQLQTPSEVIVWGRVTIEIDGNQYTQSAFGQSEIHFYKCDKVKEVQKACVKDKSACFVHTCEKVVSIGDDYKAALTDMIKKAASQWGIAMDVYSKRFETE